MPRLTIASLLLVLPTTALARDVWQVGPSGDFTTISAAITRAAAGDLILVAAGTYAECVTIPLGKPLSLVATDGADNTTITCGGSASFAVDVKAQSAIRGFQVTNVGQGLRSTAPLRLSGMAFSGCSAPSGNGGGVTATGGAVTIEDSTFTGCRAVNGAGGAIAVVGGDLTLLDVTVDGGLAKRGGGVWVSNGDLTARGLIVTGSQASGSTGGGLLMEHTATGFTLDCTDCVFSGNDAVGTGGGVHAGSATVTVRDSTFSANKSDGSGGGIAALGTIDLRSTTFDLNDSVSGGGGALYTTGDATITDCAFRDNTSGADGGAVLSEGRDVTSRDNAYERNVTTGGSGGAIATYAVLSSAGDGFVSNTAAFDGGAVYADTLTMLAGDVSDNAAGSFGGGIWGRRVVVDSTLLMKDRAASGGGGIYAYESVELTDAVVAECDTDGDGGAVSFEPSSGTALIVTSDLVDNTARGAGGAIGSSGTGATLVLVSTRVSGNRAGSGGGLSVDGGALDVTQSWFVANAATGAGGAIHTQGNKAYSVARSVICGNSAEGAGGGVATFNAAATRTYTHVAFVENTATQQGAAVFEQGVASTGVQNATFTGVTVVGNDGSPRNADGLFLATPAFGTTGRFVITNSVFQSNGDNGVAGPSGATAAVSVSESWFGDHAGSAIVGGSTGSGNDLNRTPLPISTGASGWSRGDGDCFNDVLATTPVKGAALYAPMYRDDSAVGGDTDGMTIAAGDCSPADKSTDPTSWRRPGLAEVPGNSVDEDCHLGPDRDEDGDGYLAEAVGGSDCRDKLPHIHPGASVTVNDGIDQDCDGTDELDEDGDGTPLTSDCEDRDRAAHPGGIELPYDGVDDGCLGVDLDADLDGFDAVGHGGTDCNDFRAAVNPAATEIFYDGVDQDCDGGSDFDADGDGAECADRSGCPLGGTDCDDDDRAVGPGQPEVWYDGTDSDCDGGSDFDQDGDGFDCDPATGACAASSGTDCDDTDPEVYPGREEHFDGKDSDCDGVGDIDTDGDGILDFWEDRYLAEGMRKDLADSDRDGIDDGIEWGPIESTPADTDDDGTIDAVDLESDGDTVPDQIEGAGDTDHDGILDFRDTDDDGDGVDTIDEVDPGGVPRDFDGDGLSDHLDPDSDNDGVVDGAEFGRDENDNGVPDHLDDASDGTGTGSPPAKRGFGCDTAPATPGLGVLLVLLGLRRRRRAA